MVTAEITLRHLSVILGGRVVCPQTSVHQILLQTQDRDSLIEQSPKYNSQVKLLKSLSNSISERPNFKLLWEAFPQIPLDLHASHASVLHILKHVM